jgi:RimJ/RimL family protein N-acetyltransferase
MQLLPIEETAEENHAFIQNPLCKDTIYVCIDFYKRVGFTRPWICYYVEENGQLIGSAAYKGKPVNGIVEIAYGTMELHRKQGVGTRICRLLVDIALQTDTTVTVMARTLPENNSSARVLQKNGFIFTGIVNDPEDGDVWEWRYPRGPLSS